MWLEHEEPADKPADKPADEPADEPADKLLSDEPRRMGFDLQSINRVCL